MGRGEEGKPQQGRRGRRGRKERGRARGRHKWEEWEESKRAKAREGEGGVAEGVTGAGTSGGRATGSWPLGLDSPSEHSCQRSKDASSPIRALSTGHWRRHRCGRESESSHPWTIFTGRWAPGRLRTGAPAAQHNPAQHSIALHTALCISARSGTQTRRDEGVVADTRAGHLDFFSRRGIFGGEGGSREAGIHIHPARSCCFLPPLTT